MVIQIKGIIPLKIVCVQHKNVARLVFCVLLKDKKKKEYLEYAVFGCSSVSSHEIRLSFLWGKHYSSDNGNFAFFMLLRVL